MKWRGINVAAMKIGVAAWRSEVAAGINAGELK